MDDQTQTGGHPPRPGDPVPDEGLDPSMVFASPPPPPAGQGSGQGDDGSGDDGAMPPQDSGPPPPPPGTIATKEMGYDDEDIRVLTEVGDYRFGSITAQMGNENIRIPAHGQIVFDEEMFLTLLRGSISLTRDEKWRIIQAVPKLSQFQIDELQKILEEERRKFSELSPKHLSQLMRLEMKHAEDWRDLQAVAVQEGARKEEQSQADEIRKQLGL
jgi:rRNA-processing protein FCF1